jgi:hypothetical protein
MVRQEAMKLSQEAERLLPRLTRTFPDFHGKIDTQTRNLKLTPKPTFREPWPYPRHRTIGIEEYCFNMDITILLPERSCDIVDKAVDRFKQALDAAADYNQVISDHPNRVANNTVKFLVLQTDCHNATFPHLLMDESCRY